MLKKTGYDILFEPLAIGPVTAKNRFYQVPHCCGMGHLRPRAHAAMRATKAEGGWAVVSTEEAEIHPSSDLSPYAEQRIWDERDVPALRLMTDAVHKHGALAAIELVHNGHHAPNLYSRAPALAPSDTSLELVYPKQARAMSKTDIREFRRWHRLAARRAKQAGFDIVYVYAGHSMTLTQHFLLPEFNTRSDEYGGSLENRARLIRELLEETKEEIGDTCAVALRFAVDELKGADGMQAAEEGRAVVELLAELPDLWDVNVSDWANDSQTTRFALEDGYQIPYIDFVKQVTSKPVVAVSRLSSPDMMASLIKRKVVDFIGAARPSIADPFLPSKIESNRTDEIRECIGCNICVSSDTLGVPIRCTQNPTMGDEWRRGWHPERIEPKVSEAAALVVGGGPSGLECALQLARRGYQVTLAEASDRLGGRVAEEASLKGLSAWLRVRDNRLYELQQKANVDIFTGSELSAAHIRELEIENVFLATGARWRVDGVGRSSRKAIAGLGSMQVFTPHDIMTGAALPEGPLVVYDDDQCYLGGVVADHLSAAGYDTSIVTPAAVVSPWTSYTLEQERVQRTLLQQGVKIHANRTLSHARENSIEANCVFTGEAIELPCAGLILVTERLPQMKLYRHLMKLQESGDLGGMPLRLEVIGDALAPGLIADAVYSGHLAARSFEADPDKVDSALYRREMPSLSDQR
ncbi:FAD-dependent oxidoreductase [Pelagibius sp. Alg239-R121]|uniref:FAD-dependent oxidoreductase n=1 Tax=Pelagibius sp. Alg239-R121 TaxID=2993448 RepID=UPI0024A674D4|nr:FAD-dependent oxidoreductase [Pelagibius sp. Alg239-R121]